MPRYIVETNRCVGDSVPKLKRHLRQRGFKTSSIAHLTAFRVVSNVTFARFTRILCRQLKPFVGTALVHSERTGKLYIFKGGKVGSRALISRRIRKKRT